MFIDMKKLLPVKEAVIFQSVNQISYVEEEIFSVKLIISFFTDTPMKT